MESTNNFSQEYCIGSGTYGTMYRAELNYLDRKSLLVRRDMVAIKRVRKYEDGTGDQGFSKELSMLGSYEHPNIISLLGYCDESSMRILVYEYAFKGSLSQHLESNDSKRILTWTQRIRICLDIANGLNYLHNNTKGKPRIIHRDIKRDDILLDEKWNTKIADFGLSKFHPPSQESSVIMTNHIAGTSVYLDPEYKRTDQLRRESDIYSFGVVLFEVLSGRLAYDEIYLEENGNGIAPIARQHYNEGTLKDMVDSRMKEAGDYGPSQDSLDIFSEIAYQCLAKSHVGRPTIEEIIKELQSALNSQLEYTSTQASRGIHSIGGRVSSTIKGRCSSSGVKTNDQNVNHDEDTVISTQSRLDVKDAEGVQGPVENELDCLPMMEHSSDGSMGSHSTRERVSSFIGGRGNNNGDLHADCSEDTIVVSQERLDDTSANPKPGHDSEGLEAVLEPVHLLDRRIWEKISEIEVSITADLDHSFTDKLRDKIEKMEQYQMNLEAQLEAEWAKMEKVELESKAQLEAERAKIEKLERESKGQLEVERARTAELEEMIVNMKAIKASKV